ncbi:Multicopper oxidase mco [Phytophthora ramorum]|uniref:Multicopper oxidase mco n=1 Tax=Phytophthora ramorum TaxID=164328 RepID=UPI003098541F|nr:Multicopper oxidase mco [Phytophthora ramorum]
MRLSVYLQGFLLSIVIAVVSGDHDYHLLRQPALYQSECAKQWAKLSSSSSGSSSALGDQTTVKTRTGELRINLSVQPKRFTSDYVDFNTRSYNGQIPAPTIKVCPGDRLVVTLTNELEAGSSNNTNLHLHGMHVPPVGSADNVMPNVEPGGQRRYTYDIRPDHPAGTFWYHPHTHGVVNSQLNGMMAGALVVADRPGDFPTELAAMEDFVMILQAICVEDCFNMYDNLQDALENKFSSARRLSRHMGSKGGEEVKQVWSTDLEIVEDDADVPLNDTSLPTVYVNGQYLPTLNLDVSEYKRLRFVNAIANNVAEIVTTRDSNCDLTVLAMDGIYFDKPKAKDVVVIPPGGRADVAVMCGELGEFYLETDSASSRNRLLGLVNQHRVPSQQIVKLKVNKEEDKSGGEDDSESIAEAMHLPSALPKRPSYMEDTIRSAKHALAIPESNKYGFEFSVWMDKGITYGVNHEKLDLSNINYSMPVNELQQWELSVRDYRKSAAKPCDLDAKKSKSSNCRTMSHPFHIHSTHFQVSDMDDDTDPDGVMFDVGEWRDTLPLFRGGVQVRFTPREYMVGSIFAHCHIASHVDGGMAQLVNVYDPSTRPNGDEEDEEEDSASDAAGDTDESADDDDDDGDDEEEEGDNGKRGAIKLND